MPASEGECSEDARGAGARGGFRSGTAPLLVGMAGLALSLSPGLRHRPALGLASKSTVSSNNTVTQVSTHQPGWSQGGVRGWEAVLPPRSHAKLP